MGSRRIRRAGAAIAITAIALGALAGCSKNDPPPPAGLNTVPPGNSGASCTDPTGDISNDADQANGNLSSPAGIDLVAASATLTETTLKVQYQTAGPIDGTPQPEFVLFQGDVSESGHWELKARQNASTKAWELVLTTFDKDKSGNVVEHPGQPVNAPVKVDGSTLSYEVQQKDIKPAASYVWAFGSSSGTDPDTLFDYCDNSTGATAGSTTPGSSTPTTSAPPATTPTGALRQSQTTKRGETVTVYSVESPPQSPNAGATPAEGAPEQLPGEPTPVPFKLAVVDAKICAPADHPVTVDPSSAFFVKGSDGTNYQVHAVDVPAHTPAMPPGFSLAANECKQGWVTLQLPENVSVVEVLYVVDPQNPTDALIWTA